jgi:hypothetical protein
MTKEKISTIINIYQNHINRFVNVSNEDLNKIYFQYAKSKVSIKEILQEVNKE